MQKKVYIETYGCQMNVADSEIVANILKQNNYQIIFDIKDSDIILINTCSIRDNAEQKIYKRLLQLECLRKNKKNLKIGIIGCMAERLGENLFNNKIKINFLAGPDSYRNIVSIIRDSDNNRVMDILLSNSETYDDIIPENILTNGISAFVSIMRGCENFCSYCVVPYTRGKERSRNPDTIKKEVEVHIKNNIKEIILLGQNVNSYLYKTSNEIIDFPDLILNISNLFPEIRIRFATSHPKDISDKLLYVIAQNDNICKSIHLPIQSGSTSVLKRMNRGYTRDWYLERINAIKTIIPECKISTDIICGFCGETDEEHQDTLSAMKKAEYVFAYMFKYSEREGTRASKTMKDDVPEEVKIKRLTEVINLQQELSLKDNQNDVGKIYEVLVEGVSKKKKTELMGHTSQNKVVVFEGNLSLIPIGSLVNVKINNFTSATLKGLIQ
jgi:tRNA-2-methylthio-N6-dimethylallyladenosine synthase